MNQVRVRKGGILWLDAASAVGWAYGLPDDPMPEWGVILLPTIPLLGRKLCAFENALLDLFTKFQPKMLGIEAPLPAGQQSNAHTAETLIGIAVIAEVAAYRWNIQFVRRASQTVRSAVIGRSHRTDEEKEAGLDVKTAIVAPWCKAQGWTIPDHNARDAAVGWAYEIGIRAVKPERARRAARV